MRNNQPVTQIEHKMKPDDILVSRTDLKGRIVYANKAFCDIAGFSMEELQGKPHNIVRHPDMPASAFQDLWDTMQAKKPWTGIVKNRCKNGDYYWVIANASPEYDAQGNVSGYISVRTMPTQAQINEVEGLYREVNAGKATLPSTLSASWYKKIKLKTIILSSSLLSIITVATLGWLFISQLQNDAHRTMLRVTSVPYLSAIRDVLEVLPQHRGLGNAWHHGHKNNATKLASLEQSIDASMSKLLKIAAQSPLSNLESEAKSAERDWQSLKRTWKQDSAKQSFAQHSAVINELLTLSSDIFHQGDIVTDSSLDIIHLGEFMSETVLELNEFVGRIRGLGTGIATSAKITPDERDKILKMTVQAHSIEDALVEEIKHVIHAYNPKLAAALSQPNEDLAASGDEFFTNVNTNIIDTKIIKLDPEEYFKQGSQTISSALTLYDAMHIQLGKRLQEEQAKVDQSLLISYILVGLGVFGTLILSLLMMQKTFKPLKEIVDGMQRFVEGNYRTQPVKHANDELGDIVDDMKTLQSVLQYEIFEGKAMVVANLETQRLADIEKSRLQSELANAFENNVGSLVSGLATEVEHVGNAAAEIDALADTLNTQTENTLQSVQTGSSQIKTTAAAMEEMSVTIQSVSQEISKTQDISKQAVIEAQDATTMMTNLSSVANQIGSIVGAISDIAEQTNLLALNASIEAARAGDAGRGFSVVAGEVKELANQTSLATNKIREQVEGIQSESENATQAIDKISQTIQDINNFTSNIVESMEQQSQAGREISQASQEADMSMNSANSSVENLAKSAVKVNQSSDEMITVAKSMVQSTESVQQGIQEFLETLRKN